MKQASPLQFFKPLKWLDGQPLLNVIEPYRQKTFMDALYSFDAIGRLVYNLVLCSRAKKNWKTADLVLAAIYKLLCWESTGGNQCYILANDLDQADDDLSLAKKLIESKDPKKLWLEPLNPLLNEELVIKQKVIERRDGKGFLEVLPAGDVIGSHGKTYLFAGFDEIHGYKTWDCWKLWHTTRHDMTLCNGSLAMPASTTVPACRCSTCLLAARVARTDECISRGTLADYCTDPAFADLSPEERANPSR